MSADRSWMQRRVDENGIVTSEFEREVGKMLDVAYETPRCVFDGKVRCPCKKCVNLKWKTRDEIMYDLLRKGYTNKYTEFYRHGETSGSGSRGLSSEVEIGFTSETDECMDMAIDATRPDFHLGGVESGSKESSNTTTGDLHQLLKECTIHGQDEGTQHIPETQFTVKDHDTHSLVHASSEVQKNPIRSFYDRVPQEVLDATWARTRGVVSSSSGTYGGKYGPVWFDWLVDPIMSRVADRGVSHDHVIPLVEQVLFPDDSGPVFANDLPQEGSFGGPAVRDDGFPALWFEHIVGWRVAHACGDMRTCIFNKRSQKSGDPGDDAEDVLSSDLFIGVWR